MKIMMIMSVWLAAACLAGAVEVGDDVLASGCLDGCEVSAFGRKLLAGATYLEDAYLKMQAKWIKQQINATILGEEYQNFLITNGAGAMTEIPTEESITQWVADATESWDAVLTQAGLK